MKILLWVNLLKDGTVQLQKSDVTTCDIRYDICSNCWAGNSTVYLCGSCTEHWCMGICIHWHKMQASVLYMTWTQHIEFGYCLYICTCLMWACVFTCQILVITPHRSSTNWERISSSLGFIVSSSCICTWSSHWHIPNHANWDSCKQDKGSKAPEYILHGVTEALRTIHGIFTHVWEDEVIPKEWHQSIIIPMYKGNGSRSDCSYYRWVILLSVPGKVFAHVILARISPNTSTSFVHICKT